MHTILSIFVVSAVFPLWSAQGGAQDTLHTEASLRAVANVVLRDARSDGKQAASHQIDGPGGVANE
jgi:hypothetical protein